MENDVPIPSPLPPLMRSTQSSAKHIIGEVQKVELIWIVTKSDPKIFVAIFWGEHVQVRINDFPEEPLLTLFVRTESKDLEGRPSGWHFQHKDWLYDEKADQ